MKNSQINPSKNDWSMVTTALNNDSLCRENIFKMNDETLSAKPNDVDLTLRSYLDQNEETMDLETARELLHDMVRKEYASL